MSAGTCFIMMLDTMAGGIATRDGRALRRLSTSGLADKAVEGGYHVLDVTTRQVVIEISRGDPVHDVRSLVLTILDDWFGSCARRVGDTDGSALYEPIDF